MSIEDYEHILSIHRVPISKLRSEFDPNHFSFETTKDLEQYPNEMIGQSRAEQAMEFGLSVEQKGYNLFVVGPSGTGRMSYTMDSVKRLAKLQAEPMDWCYVYNFENPDMPIVLHFPAGEGIAFQRNMESLLVDIEREIRGSFNSEVFEKDKREIIDDYRTEVEALWEQTNEYSLENQIKIERTKKGIQTIPLLFGRPMEVKEYDELSDETKELIRQREKVVEEKIQETVYQIRKIDEQLGKNVSQFMRKTAANSIEGLFQPLKENYQNNQKVITYLDSYFHDVVEHYSFLLGDNNDSQNIMNELVESNENKLNRYKVNLFVNNRSLKGAPIIYETNPSYYNLFGKVEYHGKLGNWMTDFTFIKPGKLHLANGGYLILQATELLQQPNTWIQLKRSSTNR